MCFVLALETVLTSSVRFFVFCSTGCARATLRLQNNKNVKKRISRAGALWVYFCFEGCARATLRLQGAPAETNIWTDLAVAEITCLLTKLNNYTLVQIILHMRCINLQCVCNGIPRAHTH